MARDIRLAIDMDQNPKVRRLIQDLGPEAAWALVRLWLYTARHRPEGVLTGIDLVEIEPLVGWKRRRGRLVDALERLGFITVKDTGTSREVTIHEWFVHQPWVSGQTRRSEVARQNVGVRWGKRDAGKPEAPGKYKGDDTDRTTGRTTDGNTTGSTDPILLSFPSPSPIQDLTAGAPAGGSEAPPLRPNPCSPRTLLQIRTKARTNVQNQAAQEGERRSTLTAGGIATGTTPTTCRSQI